jgi:hypothetical protein
MLFQSIRKRRNLILLILLFISININSQTKNVGRIISYNKTENGIEGKTVSSFFEIKAYNDNTIDNFSYVLVNSEFPSFSVSVTDKNNFIEVSTNSINVIV